jgi:imidazolonepropionase-like amidohydrolase
MGTQKITMGRDKRQDAIDAENARRQAGRNPYVQGIDAVMEDGVGSAIAQSRNNYGNANIMPNEVIQGAKSNFSQEDSAGNRPMEDYANQTGSLDYESSMTERPEEDPVDMENDALERRVKMIQNAAGNAEQNLNANNRGM